MYCYIQSEPTLWTVGFYSPDGKWHPDSDFSEKEKAGDRTSYLNGGAGFSALSRRVEAVEKSVSEVRSFLVL